MVSVVSDQTEISYAESVTGWAGDTFTLENEIKVQSGNSVATIQTANGSNDAHFTKATGSWDLSATTLRLYMSSNIMPNTNTEANDGIQVFLFDGTNTAYYTVGGSDTYSGGWVDWFFDPNTTATSGSVTLTAVTRVGIRINTSTKPRNSTNGWYDNWRFGNGLECNSTGTTAFNFTDIATEDALLANKYDIVENIDDVLFVKGTLTLGNAAGSLNCNLVSVNEQIVFPDRKVASDLYAIVSSEGTGTTDIDIQGLVCKTNGATGAEFDMSTAINSLNVVGSTFINMGLIKFGQDTVSSSSFTDCGASTISGNTVMTSCTWNTSGSVTISNTAKAVSSFFNPGAASTGAVVDNLNKLEKCNFTSDGTGHAVDLGTIAATTSMTWDNTESGYAATDGSTGNETIRVTVNSGQTLTINVAATGSTPTIKNDGTGTVTVVAGQKAFSFTVNPSITGYEWRLYENSAVGGVIGTTELDGQETATQDNQSYNYTYSTDTDVALQIIATGYEESVTYHTLGNNNQNLTINLTKDDNL